MYAAAPEPGALVSVAMAEEPNAEIREIYEQMFEIMFFYIDGRVDDEKFT